MSEANLYSCLNVAIKSFLFFFYNRPHEPSKQVITLSCSSCLIGGHHKSKHQPMFKTLWRKFNPLKMVVSDNKKYYV